MRIAICDDEKVIREQIENLIKKCQKDSRIIQYASGEELLSAHMSFDLIFLDIYMKGLNGIDIARELRRRKEKFVLIFVTGAKEYVFDAFDVSAFHYLLKPIEEKRFVEIFDRARAQTERGKKEEQLFVKVEGRYVSVNKKQILYISSRARKLELHNKENSGNIF